MVVRSASALGVGLHVAVPRFLRLTFLSGYAPMEIFNLGLLGNAPVISPQLYLSKSRLYSLQQRVNPRQCFPHTEDKLVFYERCIEHGLETPRVYAVLSRRADDAAGAAFATSPDSLLAALGTQPCDIAFKPVAGVYGEGLLLLRFDGRSFSSSDGTAYLAQDLFAYAGKWKYADWLLQQRLFPHRELAGLSGTEAIQTARVITCLDANGNVHIPFAWLRIINGSSAVDNFQFGLTGNLSSTLDTKTGRLERVFGPRRDRCGLEFRTHHPATGVPFDGLTVPYWAEVRSLTERAARAFAPLRTIGWDVAITDTGPALLEGNVTWDPLPTQQELRTVVRLLQ